MRKPEPASPETPPAAPEEQPPLFQGGPLDSRESDGALPNLMSSDDPPADPPATPAPSDPPADPPAEPVPPQEDPERAALEARLEQSDSVIRQLLESARGVPADPATPAATPTPALTELGEPPDAVSQPKEFAAWVANIPKVVDARIAAEVEAGRSEITEEAFREKLWTDFQTDNEDLAGDPDLVSAVFALEFKKANGVIPRDPKGSKAFLDAIATRIRGARALEATPKPTDEPTRTAGVSGASTPASPPPAKPDGEEKPTPFSEQLLNHQPSEFF